jgi:hypothetical protein
MMATLEIVKISKIGELPRCMLENFVMGKNADEEKEIARAVERYQMKHGQKAETVYQLGIQLFVAGEQK